MVRKLYPIVIDRMGHQRPVCWVWVQVPGTAVSHCASTLCTWSRKMNAWTLLHECWTLLQCTVCSVCECCWRNQLWPSTKPSSQQHIIGWCSQISSVRRHSYVYMLQWICNIWFQLNKECHINMQCHGILEWKCSNLCAKEMSFDFYSNECHGFSFYSRSILHG